MKKHRIKFISVNIILLLFLPISHLYGAGCKLQTQVSLNFGTYNPFANLPADSTGIFNISCIGETAGSYQLSLSPGESHNFLARRMSNHHYNLYYNLYTNPARTFIWGDGTNSTAAMSGGNICRLTNSCSQVIYGRIMPHQFQAGAGYYSDIIIATLTY